ncbi:ABC transporter permease [Tersicoccus sp. Bi-70]|uniref:ABC transporter permease n=1 Tax=Tersicoccus sp. Bi-70 TaxID=1897634 RepID=UPI000977A5DF|nr:ABC transporter permease [Tersicoccus sp. Bi-70]OMH36732.1 ATPase [Tersicoccus sp. Bi-70]
MSTTLDAPRTIPTGPTRATRLRRALLGRDAAIVVLLIVVYLIGYTTVPYFAGSTTIAFLLLDVLPILLIALPMTLIIITGEIDLSVASTLGLSSVLVGVLFQAGWPIPAAAAVAILVGIVAGALNGFLITTVGLPSLAVTVGTLALYRGIAVGLLGTNAITGFPPEWQAVVTTRLGGDSSPFPAILLLFVVLAAVFIVVLHLTPVGRAIYAAGLNDEAAAFSGVDTGRLTFWLYVASGLLSAVAGVLWTLQYNSARGDNALGLELSVVAAVLVGGVSIFGGRGALPGVIAAVLTIGVLRSVLRLANVTDDVINVLTGALLIASVLLPRAVTAVGVLRHRAARRPART